MQRLNNLKKSLVAKYSPIYSETTTKLHLSPDPSAELDLELLTHLPLEDTTSSSMGLPPMKKSKRLLKNSKPSIPTLNPSISLLI